ncbi:MAG: BlaI/MecI/CopY family transcriptional regulator [Myxococcaceae bacterium]
MASASPAVTEAEFQLLKVLWSLEHATVAQVREKHEALTGATLAYTTVMTLLGRLVEKGAVTVDREREPFVYAPASRRHVVLRDRLKSFLEQVFDGDADELVLHLVETEALAPEDLGRIRQQLARRKKEGER